MVRDQVMMLTNNYKLAYKDVRDSQITLLVLLPAYSETMVQFAEHAWSSFGAWSSLV